MNARNAYETMVQHFSCAQINIHTGILDTILNVQPKEGGGGGGETRESIVYQLAEDMLRKLPPKYVQFEVREALQRLGAFLPMNIFFRYLYWFLRHYNL